LVSAPRPIPGPKTTASDESSNPDSFTRSPELTTLPVSECTMRFGEYPRIVAATAAGSRYHIAFDVLDLEETMKELKRRGVEVVVEPYAIGWKEAYIKDPNGIWIELLQRKEGSYRILIRCCRIAPENRLVGRVLHEKSCMSGFNPPHFEAFQFPG
jgi:predicted enzyme related to lactoylglutathione lyase